MKYKWSHWINTNKMLFFDVDIVSMKLASNSLISLTVYQKCRVRSNDVAHTSVLSYSHTAEAHSSQVIRASVSGRLQYSEYSGCGTDFACIWQMTKLFHEIGRLQILLRPLVSLINLNGFSCGKHYRDHPLGIAQA